MNIKKLKNTDDQKCIKFKKNIFCKKKEKKVISKRSCRSYLIIRNHMIYILA